MSIYWCSDSTSSTNGSVNKEVGLPVSVCEHVHQLTPICVGCEIDHTTASCPLASTHIVQSTDVSYAYNSQRQQNSLEQSTRILAVTIDDFMIEESICQVHYKDWDCDLESIVLSLKFRWSSGIDSSCYV